MPRPDVLPAAPFADWLNERIAYWDGRLGDDSAQSRVCVEVGWGAHAGMRRLYRYRRQLSESQEGKSKARGLRGRHVVRVVETYQRRVVEEALHHAGVRLGEVYPYEALVDEFAMEYVTTRDLARRLADVWIENTWQTVWEGVGIFVTEEDRPSAYCRECRKTSRLFAGTCESCGSPDVRTLIAAWQANAKPKPATSDVMAAARLLREQYRMPYAQIASVMALYHGVTRTEDWWRSKLRGLGVPPVPHGVPFEVAA